MVSCMDARVPFNLNMQQLDMPRILMKNELRFSARKRARWYRIDPLKGFGMKTASYLIAASALLLQVTSAHAAPVTFNWSYTDGGKNKCWLRHPHGNGGGHDQCL